MSKRVVDTADGFSAASAPSLTGSVATVTGSTGSPTAITASGVTVSDVSQEIIFIEGSGGAVEVTGSPAISAGSVVGQKLTLLGTSDANAVQFNSGNGIRLNGAKVMKNHSVLEFVWDGTLWKEEYRK